METPDEENIVFKTAASFINNTNHPVFLTGKAGTGKTTFLKYIRQNTGKNTAVVAPTGVAAINAGGTTIHSFFQIPFGPFIPGNSGGWGKGSEANDTHNLISKLKLSRERLEVMQQLELLIIDEISMVRCDLLDAIDTILRHVRNRYLKPFGGVQVLYIGDMYQLPPVAQNDWPILKEYYASEFFFSSKVCVQYPPVYIELKKVYRQSDPHFIELLNQVRNNEMENGGYEQLHSRYLPQLLQQKNADTITLTTHNNIADNINNNSLQELIGGLFTFKALIEGDFFEKSYPAEELLKLKKGAQVMFIKNDTEKIRRYFNGKIGIIEEVEDDKIIVACKKGKNIETIEVKKETWRNIKYTLNKTNNKIEEEELGSFTQYPLRLAWAITIHKSQGLTFDKVIIDAGNAFAPGQVYVALSRCTTLEGIILKSKISYSNLYSDERIIRFSKTQQSDVAQQQLLQDAMAIYQQDEMLGLVNFMVENKALENLYTFINQNNFGKEVAAWLEKIKNEFAIYLSHSNKFTIILQQYFIDPGLPENNKALQERYGKAARWFLSALGHTKQLLLQSPGYTDNRQLATEYNTKLHELFDCICIKMQLLNSVVNGFNTAQYQQQKASIKKEAFTINAYAGKATYVPSDVKHAKLYELLKNKRDELCQEHDLPVYMVCNTKVLAEICHYLPQNINDFGKINGFGKVKLRQFGKTFLGIVQDYCSEYNLQSSIEEIKEKKKQPTKNSLAKPNSKLVSFDLFMQGKSIDEIAAERNFSAGTIEGHLIHFIEIGRLDIHQFLTAQQQAEMSEIINQNTGLTLNLLKAKLPNYSFGEIRMMLASEKYKASNG